MVSLLSAPGLGVFCYTVEGNRTQDGTQDDAGVGDGVQVVLSAHEEAGGWE